MIAKWIIILAITAQIYGSPCDYSQGSIALPFCESDSCSSPCSSGSAVVQPSCSSSSSGSSSASDVITENIIAKGKYPVALKNSGPTPEKHISVTTSHVTTPVQEKPTVRLPCNIPAPKIVHHSCTCYKTILKPRVCQQVITVPTVQRYLQTIHKPVVQNIQYEAMPLAYLGSGSSSSGSLDFPLPGVLCSSPDLRCAICESPCKTVEIPRYEVVEAPSQVVEIPSCQVVEVPKCETIEIPPLQIVKTPKCVSFRESCSSCQC